MEIAEVFVTIRADLNRLKGEMAQVKQTISHESQVAEEDTKRRFSSIRSYLMAGGFVWAFRQITYQVQQWSIAAAKTRNEIAASLQSAAAESNRMTGAIVDGFYDATGGMTSFTQGVKAGFGESNEELRTFGELLGTTAKVLGALARTTAQAFGTIKDAISATLGAMEIHAGAVISATGAAMRLVPGLGGRGKALQERGGQMMQVGGEAIAGAATSFIGRGAATRELATDLTRPTMSAENSDAFSVARGGRTAAELARPMKQKLDWVDAFSLGGLRGMTPSAPALGGGNLSFTPGENGQILVEIRDGINRVANQLGTDRPTVLK